MNMREIIEHQVIQGTDEWRECRLGKMTGSHFSDIMPSDRPKTRFTQGQLTYLRKVAAEILTGISSEREFTNKSMDWGEGQEELARIAVSDHLMAPIRTCGFFEFSEYSGSSPDGIIGDMDCTLELKNPDSQTHLKYWLDPMELWKEYRWQAVGEMLCTGIDRGLVVSYDSRMPEDKQMAICEPPETFKDDLKKLEDRIGECTELIKGWIS